MSQNRDAAFREVQKFRQWWVWLLVYGAAALTWYSFIQQIVLGQPFGSNPGPDWMVWLIWLACGIGLPALFHILKLVVEVRHHSIQIQYVPLLTREIPFEEIESFAVRKYNPIREYGGWGIRGRGRKKKAFNVSGDRGVDLRLRSGEEILIGSQKPEQLAQALPADRRRAP